MKEGDTWRASVSPSHGGQRKSRRRPDSVDGVAHGKPRNDLFTYGRSWPSTTASAPTMRIYDVFLYRVIANYHKSGLNLNTADELDQCPSVGYCPTETSSESPARSIAIRCEKSVRQCRARRSQATTTFTCIMGSGSGDCFSHCDRI